MTGVHIKIEGLDELINDLDAMARPPARTAERLDGLLDEAFALTQQSVHVRRGVTKETGLKFSGFVGDTWHGYIDYGDPAGDIHETGAWWLTHDKEHPDRDYYAPLDALDPQFEEAIDAWFESHIG